MARRNVFWKNSPCANDGLVFDGGNEEREDGVQLVMTILVVLAVTGLVFMLLRMKGPCGGGGEAGSLSAKVGSSPPHDKESRRHSGSTLSKKEDVEEVIRMSMDGTLVVVMFHAPWCGHCKNTLPEFKKCCDMCKENEKISFHDINADEALDAETLSKYKIEGYPSIRLFKNGSLVAELPHEKREASAMKSFVHEHL